MNRATERRWTGRTSRKAGVALRLCVALWLVVYIVYTPIHLYVEPHSDRADVSTGAAPAGGTGFVANEEQDGDGHHERHSGEQHKFKVLRSQRAAAAGMVLVTPAGWVDAERHCPQPQAVTFSGLSPPEIVHSWQFFSRAALPVRAPSVLS